MEVPDEENSEEGGVCKQKVLAVMQKLKEKKRKRKVGELTDTKKAKYLNVEFICGSAEEVEWLWSICNYILTVNRTRFSPILLEAILFLRINRSFWNMKLMQESYVNIKEEQRNARLQRQMIKDDDYIDDEMEDNHMNN